MTTFPRKTPHLNGCWSNKPQDTRGSYWISNKSQKNKKTLEKKGSQTQKKGKGTVASLRQRNRVTRESRRRLAMSEEARRRRMAHAPSSFGAWGTGLICTVGACDSHAPFPATRLDGWGRRRSAHLPRGSVVPRYPKLCVSKNTPSTPRVPPKFLQIKIVFFLENSSSRL